MAKDEDGVFYMLENTTSSLYTVDIETGISTLIDIRGIGGLIERDLAFDPTTGFLYGLYNYANTGSQQQLFTINKTTGM